jgi:hypothetical protein
MSSYDAIDSFSRFLDSMGPIVLIFVVGFAIVWGILLFLLPFFVFGAWRRTVQCNEQLDTTIALHRATNAQLALLVTIAERQSAIDASEVPVLDNVAGTPYDGSI